MREIYIPPKTISELLERYKNGERYFVGCDFDDRIYDFRNLNLVEINLSKSFIVGDFRGANLSKADLSNSNLKTCDFRQTNLADANFEKSALCATYFGEAVFENTNFEGAFYHSHELKKGETPDW
ncbi:MAG TPA: pentapeptide repeat-containing protein [Pyrinomonadaceae bacterium]|jgi:uncharacterized protein YjbI with pentapeptide repeats